MNPRLLGIEIKIVSSGWKILATPEVIVPCRMLVSREFQVIHFIEVICG